MLIAIDFDDTIFNVNEQEIILQAIEVINEWYDKGNEITIFTNRPDWEYSFVKEKLDLAGINYHRIICGKPSYNIFIDNRALKFYGDWNKTKEEVECELEF